MRALALDTAPFGVRAELMAHRLCCESNDDDGPRLVLTDLGFAKLKELLPLDERERQELSARADRALARDGEIADAPPSAEADSVPAS